MRGAEAEERLAAVDVPPVVVGVGNVQLAGVFVGVAVTVAGERGLVVVVEISVAVKRKISADCNPETRQESYEKTSSSLT
jgi:CO dehydrogenase/acetyl-CoA synthase delta subunit